MIDLSDFIALSLLPLSWGRDIAERLRAGRRAGDVFDALIAERWPRQPARRAWIASRTAKAIDRAASGGFAVITWGDAQYPPALAAIVDPPPVLWLRGAVSSLVARPSVAIVGSRAATPYALEIAGQLAADLASRGLTIVSGLARGVDSAAHRGALTGGGETIAVLGSGVDVMYPPEHAPLARDIEQRGAVISELVPGTPPNAIFFPQRNRIISGLSRAIVVIEAGQKSGSLITARCALDQGRDVLAVPGNVLSGRNRGAHALLRDGAKIVESADDILEELGLCLHGGAAAEAASPGPRADPILACLTRGEPCDLDTIADRTGLPSSKLLPRLFELELQGCVRRAGGGRFVRS
ncbi:MAG TPA: DNA-processing protein DprA [Vicinamibacterales bacterium]|jgi:DNA processing protein|nr:DNA-processing protein DprA [Vicinamibacterales bacterium]